jgi:hypothetical protein
MSLRLRPMREDEFAAYLERSRAGYEEELIRGGRMPPEAALRKADADFAQLFADGPELLEQEVRARGLPQMQLNVFGSNARARGLYRSLGFEELSVQMGKELA